MRRLMLIDPDPKTLAELRHTIRSIHHCTLLTAPTGQDALELLRLHSASLIISELHLPDMSGLDVVRDLRHNSMLVPFIILTGSATTTRAVVTAIRMGAVDFLEKPLSEEARGRIVDLINDGDADLDATMTRGVLPTDIEPHAAARWAQALAPIVRAHRDPRTLQSWSRVVFAAPGTLRNWCRTAGISSRRSLLFGRLLRAVHLSRAGRITPENLLDVADRRTLVRLLESAGFNPSSALPNSVEEFVHTQLLIRDPYLRSEVLKALAVTHVQADTRGTTTRP